MSLTSQFIILLFGYEILVGFGELEVQELTYKNRPEKPLKWLAEFLEQRSREVEGDKGGGVKAEELEV